MLGFLIVLFMDSFDVFSELAWEDVASATDVTRELFGVSLMAFLVGLESKMRGERAMAFHAHELQVGLKLENLSLSKSLHTI